MLPSHVRVGERESRNNRERKTGAESEKEMRGNERYYEKKRREQIDGVEKGKQRDILSRVE